MLQLAEKSQDPALLVVASMCWAKVYVFQGDLVLSQQLGERALALDRRESHDAYLAVYNEDGGLSARREHSFCLWMRGYPDRALALAYEAVTLAKLTAHPFTRGAAHHTAGSVRPCVGIGRPVGKSLRQCSRWAKSTPWETCSNMPPASTP